MIFRCLLTLSISKWVLILWGFPGFRRFSSQSYTQSVSSFLVFSIMSSSPAESLSYTNSQMITFGVDFLLYICRSSWSASVMSGTIIIWLQNSSSSSKAIAFLALVSTALGSLVSTFSTLGVLSIFNELRILAKLE